MYKNIGKTVFILATMLFITIIGLILGGCANTTAPTPTPSNAAAPKPTATTTTPPTSTTLTPTTATPTVTAPAKVYSWKMITAFAKGDSRLGHLEQWADAVRTVSNGAITITIYPSDSLIKTADVPNALSQGVVELAGTFTPSYYAGTVPVAALRQIFVVKDYAKFITDSEVLRILNEEAAQKVNAYYLSAMSTGGVEFYLKTPFTSPEDMKGKLIRTGGGVYDDFVTTWGGKPASLATSELYNAAQTGVIDGCQLSIASYSSAKLYEVMPYVLRTNLMLTSMPELAINLTVWKGLPNNLQKALQDTIGQMLPKFHGEIVASDGATLDKLSKAGSAKIQNLSSQQQDEWLKRVLPSYESRLNAAGPVGKEMLQYLKKSYWIN